MSKDKVLAQPAQEPVAHVYLFDHDGKPRVAWDNAKSIKIGDRLYTTPPAAQPQVRTGDCLLVGVCASEGHKIQAQRPWVGLTDEDLEFWTEELGQGELGKGVIRAVADHLKEKNT
jgi:hypothetical protein